MSRPTKDQLNEKHRLHSEGLRRCSRCQEIKDLSEYGEKKVDVYGLQNWCKPCINAYNRINSKTPEKMVRKNETNRIWRKANLTPEDYRRKNLWAQYKITPEDYNRMFKEQGGKCGICGSSNPYGMKGSPHFHVDHCHETNKVRKLLCGRCNPALGAFQHDTMILKKAIAYLESFS